MRWHLWVMIPLSLLLETSFANRLVLWGAKPDITLVIVMISGLLYGPKTGGAMGLTAGILQDFMLGRYMGMFSFTRAFVGIVSGVVGVRLFKENPFLPSILSFGGSVVSDLIIVGLLYFLGVGTGPFARMLRLLIFAGVYNAIIAQPVVFMIKRLRSKTMFASGA